MTDLDGLTGTRVASSTGEKVFLLVLPANEENKGVADINPRLLSFQQE